MELPRPALVVLVGPSCSGKSTWAAERFAAHEVVSSDRLRAVVGEAEDDLAASSDAFALLDTVAEMRLRRGLTAVVDTLGLDPARRRGWVELAARHDVPAVAVVLDAPAEVCRARNRQRQPRPLPQDVLNGQLRQLRAASAAVEDEGFALVVRPDAGGEAGAAPSLQAAPAAGKQPA